MHSVEKILRTLRGDATPAAKWKSIVALCQKESTSNCWRHLPRPKIGEDIDRAAAWLTKQFKICPVPIRGIYLGLDTLNMRSGRGANVEIGISDSANPVAPDDKRWLYERQANWYGKNHLIRSLVGMKREYTRERWEYVSPDPDYAVFLGYSGVILSSAFEQATRGREVVAIWGFHDGDLFTLGARVKNKFKLVMK